MGKQEIRTLCACVLAFTALVGSATAATCPEQSKVEAVINRSLPALVLSEPAADQPDPCSIIASGDFNADGAKDYAVVLTEKVAPRKYADGAPFFSSYVVVLLASKLPYAQYQAIVLLGHSTPKHIALEVTPSGIKGKPDKLSLLRYGYSRTDYEWTPAGFAATLHEAD